MDPLNEKTSARCASPGSRSRGSALLEACLWALLGVGLVALLEQRFVRCWRGFGNALAEQRRTLRR